MCITSARYFDGYFIAVSGEIICSITSAYLVPVSRTFRYRAVDESCCLHRKCLRACTSLTGNLVICNANIVSRCSPSQGDCLRSSTADIASQISRDCRSDRIYSYRFLAKLHLSWSIVAARNVNIVACVEEVVLLTVAVPNIASVIEASFQTVSGSDINSYFFVARV
ncbi:hypothetical protein D3C86_1156510 [compost metagenome]